MKVIIIVAIVLYLVGTILIGVLSSKKNKNADDFYLGGRKLGPLVTAMSAEASDMSSYLLMGLPGLALALGIANGFAEVTWTAIGLAIGTYLNWLIVAKRIRTYTEKTKSVTIPDFFSDRFHDKSGISTLVAAIVIIVFFVPYTASGFSAIGKLFNSIFGINYHVAMIIGGVVISLYTVLGGFLAASVSDLVQSIVMTIALIVIVCFGISNAGGMANVISNAQATVSGANVFSLTGPDGSFGIIQIISTLAWGLGYFGMPHILLRFMAIKSKDKLTLSRRIASIWVIISMGIAIFIGVIGYSFAINNGLANIVEVTSERERIIIYMSDFLAQKGVFFAFIAGIILAGILAATMSTADSQMLAASSSASENIVHRFFWKDMPEKAQIWFARGTVILIAIIAIFFAWDENSSVFGIVSFAWAGFGAAFGPAVILSLFWKRMNKYGAFAGIISGGAFTFIWKFLIKPLGGIFSIYELLPAFLVSLLCIVVVSLLTPAPEQEVLDEFEEVQQRIKTK